MTKSTELIRGQSGPIRRWHPAGPRPETVRMSILNWPACERPREKLMEHGAHSLSNAELLAVFFGTGNRGGNAVDLAHQLLARFGSLRELLCAEREQALAGP